MPIIVDEVVISVEVGKRPGGASSPPDADATHAIVAECVERVLDLLELKKER